MDAKAIADAIATRFQGVTATVGTKTESIAIGPTASLPNGIGKGPALLVYPPTGTTHLGTQRRREDVMAFAVLLLRDPLNYPERSDWLYAWYTAMRDRIEMNYDLDLAYVAWAGTEGDFRLELDGEQYAGITYDVVELTAQVRLDETVTTVAI